MKHVQTRYGAGTLFLDSLKNKKSPRDYTKNKSQTIFYPQLQSGELQLEINMLKQPQGQINSRSQSGKYFQTVSQALKKPMTPDQFKSKVREVRLKQIRVKEEQPSFKIRGSRLENSRKSLDSLQKFPVATARHRLQFDRRPDLII